MSDFVQTVRCRNCGQTTEAVKETGDDGNPRFVAPELCPHCKIALVFDVLGPADPVDLLAEPGTGDDDTPAFPPVNYEDDLLVKVIHVTAPAYGEAHTGGLDLRTVTPTGAHGVITVGDVYDALAAAASGEVVG